MERAIAELSEIAKLPGLLDGAVPFLPDRRRDHSAFWDKAKEVNALFKTTRLRPETRTQLWAKHQRLCEDVKELQQREREHKTNTSKRNYEEIISVLREARSWANAATKLHHLGECRTRLGDAMRRMKEGFLLKDDCDECWALWREINSLLPFRREDICGLNYDVIRGEVHEVVMKATYGDPYEARKAIQDMQRDINTAELTNEQKKRIRETLQEYWDVADGRIKERKAEGARKHSEWRSMMSEKQGRLRALVEKNDEIVGRLREQIDDLESKINEAWNDDWADRARDWVREKYEKIADIERTNEELEEKIREIREKLAEG